MWCPCWLPGADLQTPKLQEPDCLWLLPKQTLGSDPHSSCFRYRDGGAEGAIRQGLPSLAKGVTAVALTVTEAATWRTHLRMPRPSNCNHFFFVVFTRAERWRKAHPQPLLNKGPGKLSCEFIHLFFLTAVWGSFLIQQTDCFSVMQAVPWSS